MARSEFKPTSTQLQSFWHFINTIMLFKGENKNRTGRWKSIGQPAHCMLRPDFSSTSDLQAQPVYVIKCVLQIILCIVIGHAIRLWKSLFFISVPYGEMGSLYIYMQSFHKAWLDSVKSPWIQCFSLGQVGWENTMHHPLSSYYPNGYRLLKFNEIMANPLNRNRGETLTIRSRKVNWP